MTGDPDELVRAASEAVEAWCAANPAPAWPVLPDGVRAGDFTVISDGTLVHDPSGGTLSYFSVSGEPVRITYMRTAGPRERVQARLMLEGCQHEFQPRAEHWPEIMCSKCNVIVDEHGARFEDEEPAS